MTIKLPWRQLNNAGSQLNRKQARRQVRNQPGTLVRRMTESNLICNALKGERGQHPQ